LFLGGEVHVALEVETLEVFIVVWIATLFKIKIVFSTKYALITAVLVLIIILYL